MALAVTIGIFNQVAHLRDGTLRITRTDGNRVGRCDFTLNDVAPALGTAAVVADGATTYFSGTVSSVRITQPTTRLVACQVSCVDTGAIPATTEAPFAMSDATPAETYAVLMSELNPYRWFRLDEPTGDAIDIGSAGVNGTYQGTPTRGVTGAFTTDADKAITLNGSSQWIDVGSNNVRGQAAFTISVWAKVAANAATQVLYGERADPATTPYVLFVLDTNGRPALLYRDNAGTTDTVSCSSGDWCDGAWHHFVLVKDGIGIGLWVDGIARKTANLTASDTLTGTMLGRIGRQTSGDYLAGSVDEVAIWRTNIGSAGVKSLYAMRDIRPYHTLEVEANTDPVAGETYTAVVSTLYPGLAPGQELTLWVHYLEVAVPGYWFRWAAPPINEVAIEWLNATTPKWTVTIGDPLPRLAKKF